MLKQIALGLTAALSVTAASAASAADWWLLSRPPATGAAMFADTDTLHRSEDGHVSLRVLWIDRAGRSTERMETVDCAKAGRRSADKLTRFACASPRERDSYGLILAGISPADAAQTLFNIGPVEAEPR